jgi:hypothetical protein
MQMCISLFSRGVFKVFARTCVSPPHMRVSFTHACCLSFSIPPFSKFPLQHGLDFATQGARCGSSQIKKINFSSGSIKPSFLSFVRATAPLSPKPASTRLHVSCIKAYISGFICLAPYRALDGHNEPSEKQCSCHVQACRFTCWRHGRIEVFPGLLFQPAGGTVQPYS